MGRVKSKGVVQSIVTCTALYFAITIAIQFASGPLLRTARTEGFYHSDIKWLLFIGLGGLASVIERSRVPLAITAVLYWVFFSPNIAWSGPGDQLQSVVAITNIKRGLYLGGTLLYAFALVMIIPKRSPRRTLETDLVG